MMYSNWKVQIRNSAEKIGFDLIVYSQTPRGYEVLTKIDGDLLTVEAVPEGKDVKPLHLPREIVEALAIALDELYKGKRGEYVEGELAATKTHLSDLRNLLKLPKTK